MENALLPILKMPRMAVQKSLAQSFYSNSYDCPTVTATIIQQWLAQFFNSLWHNSSTFTGTILQQSLARFFLFPMLAEFLNSDVHCWRIMPCTMNTTYDPILIISTSFSMFSLFPYFHIFHIFHFLFRVCGKGK